MSAFLRWRATGRSALGATFEQTDYELSDMFATLESVMVEHEAKTSESAIKHMRDSFGAGRPIA